MDTSRKRLTLRDKYFFLNDSSILVKGAFRGAIYNLRSGDVFSIDNDSTKILSLLTDGKSLNETARVSGVNLSELHPYLKKLDDDDLGSFFTSNLTRKRPNIEKPSSKLNLIWLELTTACNLKCLHCYNGSRPFSIQAKKIDSRTWSRCLLEARELGCKKCQFIGGEPLMLGKQLYSLIKFARELKYDCIELFTNGTLLNDELIDIFRMYNVSVAVSLYGNSAKVHERVTRRVGSFHRTISNLRELVINGIPLRVSIIVMKQNEDHLHDTIEFLHDKIGVNNIDYDLVRPSGRGCNKKLMPKRFNEKFRLTKPKFPQIDKDTFVHRRYFHNCFSRSLCITSNGNVTPCIMIRDKILGNISNQSLINVFENCETQNFRKLTKNVILVCRDCEYRYLCFDCRVWAPDDNFLGKPIWCSYDPYSGKWL